MAQLVQLIMERPRRPLVIHFEANAVAPPAAVPAKKLQGP